MNDSPDLDAIDRRILSALQTNGAISNAELASRVGSSPASVWRRIKALEDSGLLKPPVRLLDPEKIGFGVNILCSIRLRSHAREVRDAFEQLVHSRPEILECFSMSGEWDYLLRIVARDVAGYERFLMDYLLDHPAVGSASSHFALSMTKYTTALPV